jgi:hypothetical protein
MIGICHELRIVLNTVLCFRRREGRGKKGGRERRKWGRKGQNEGKEGRERLYVQHIGLVNSGMGL